MGSIYDDAIRGLNESRFDNGFGRVHRVPQATEIRACFYVQERTIKYLTLHMKLIPKPKPLNWRLESDNRVLASTCAGCRCTILLMRKSVVFLLALDP